jgi:hypothetical protein
MIAMTDPESTPVDTAAVATTAVERALSETLGEWAPVDAVSFAEPERRLSAAFIRQWSIGDTGARADPRGLLVRGARVTGRLDLSYCEITHPLGFIDCHFEEEPDLRRLRIPALTFEGCSLPGINADSTDVRSSLSFERSTISGMLSLLGANVGGDLLLGEATIVPPVGLTERATALRGRCMRISGVLNLEQATFFGQVRIPSSVIGADIVGRGAVITASGRHSDDRPREPEWDWRCALIADGAQVGMSCDLGRVTTTGEISLIGARIGTDVNLANARLTAPLEAAARTPAGPRGDAVSCDGAEIGGNVDLSQALVHGTVRLNAAHVKGCVQIVESVLTGARTILNMVVTEVDLALVLREANLAGHVELFGASVGTLDDDVATGECGLGSWAGTSATLEGFSYRRFAGSAASGVRERTRWLRLSGNYEPGAWEQLIAVYRASGRDGDARAASIAAETDRLRRAHLTRTQRTTQWLLRLTIGYGYRSWLAGMWAAAIVSAYAFVVANSAFAADNKAPGPSPPAFVYAADVFLPIIDFGQAALWTPLGAVRFVHWSVILSGWILTTLFVAGFTKVVRS